MSDLPPWVAEYVGIPYLDYGRTRDGCDCWGLVRMIWKEQAGLDLPEFAVNPQDGLSIQDTINAQLGPWDVIVPGDERELDAALMTGCFGKGLDMKRATMHVGLVLGGGYMIHTTTNTGSSVLVRYNDRILGHSIVGFYRHRTLDD